jgi:hypothetical protein
MELRRQLHAEVALCPAEPAYCVITQLFVSEGKWRGYRVVQRSTPLSLLGALRKLQSDAHASTANSEIELALPAKPHRLVHSVERRKLLSAPVPSHSKWAVPSAISQKEIGSGAHSNTKFCRCQEEKKGSGLRPSEKELPDGVPARSVTKISLTILNAQQTERAPKQARRGWEENPASVRYRTQILQHPASPYWFNT